VAHNRQHSLIIERSVVIVKTVLYLTLVFDDSIIIEKDSIICHFLLAIISVLRSDFTYNRNGHYHYMLRVTTSHIKSYRVTPSQKMVTPSQKWTHWVTPVYDSVWLFSDSVWFGAYNDNDQQKSPRGFFFAYKTNFCEFYLRVWINLFHSWIILYSFVSHFGHMFVNNSFEIDLCIGGFSLFRFAEQERDEKIITWACGIGWKFSCQFGLGKKLNRVKSHDHFC